MTWTAEVAGSVLTLSLCGELDLACAEVFDGLFDVETRGVDTVVLDLGALTFCDVSGANGLSGLSSFHRLEGREVRVVEVLPHVRRLIALTQDATHLSPHGGAPA
jgi:anti-anti-sigma factor